MLCLRRKQGYLFKDWVINDDLSDLVFDVLNDGLIILAYGDLLMHYGSSHSALPGKESSVSLDFY